MVNLRRKVENPEESNIKHNKTQQEGEKECTQLAICILMSLKSSRVMPRSLSSGCTTSTSSWSKSCLLRKTNASQDKHTGTK